MLNSAFNRALLELWRLKFRDVWYKGRIRQVLSLDSQQKSERGILRSVRLLSNFPGLWQRTIQQTPKGSCQWGSTLFVAEGAADHYVILNSIFDASGGPLDPSLQLPQAARVWGLHMEPEEYVRLLHYDSLAEHSLTSRFYTSSEYLLAKGGVYRPSPPYVHFLTGKSWDFLAAALPPRKSAQLAVIASDINHLEGHRHRQQFLERLDASDIDCEIWGRGDSLKRLHKYRGFALNKWDVHSRCRYSIVIENSNSPLYWSEKVADALLSYSLPLYHGCSGLADFLPANSFEPIDIRDFGCIDRIRGVLRDDPYRERMAEIVRARQLLLYRFNVYAFLDAELNARDLAASAPALQVHERR